jgi:hypothetical protein
MVTWGPYFSQKSSFPAQRTPFPERCHSKYSLLMGLLYNRILPYFGVVHPLYPKDSVLRKSIRGKTTGATVYRNRRRIETTP